MEYFDNYLNLLQFSNSKKNSFCRNYMRKYSMLKIVKDIGIVYCHSFCYKVGIRTLLECQSRCRLRRVTINCYNGLSYRWLLCNSEVEHYFKLQNINFSYINHLWPQWFKNAPFFYNYLKSKHLLWWLKWVTICF